MFPWKEIVLEASHFYGERDFMSWGATDAVLTEQWQRSGLRRFVTKVSACLWRQKLEANQQPYTATEAHCNWMTCSLSLPVLDLFGFWKPEKEEVAPPHIILWLNVGLVVMKIQFPKS